MLSSLCCNFQPCDAADENEPTKQEKEDTASEQSESNTGMYRSSPVTLVLFGDYLCFNLRGSVCHFLTYLSHRV